MKEYLLAMAFTAWFLGTGLLGLVTLVGEWDGATTALLGTATFISLTCGAVFWSKQI